MFWNLVLALLFPIRPSVRHGERLPGDVRRHDGSGHYWATESSALDALRLVSRTPGCEHLRAGRPCTHAAEPPSRADMAGAFGPQRGRHADVRRAVAWVPPTWTPPSARRAIEDTRSWDRTELAEMLAGAA